MKLKIITVLLTIILVVGVASASNYTRMSEQNASDAREKLSTLDLVGAITSMLDSIHWSNMAIEDVEVTPTPTPVLMDITITPTESPAPLVIVTEEPTPVPTSTPTTLPTESDESKNHRDVWVGQ